MQYWLLKTEPEEFSIDDLKKRGEEPWTGIRNFVARKYLKEMQLGDLCLVYHTASADPIGVYGLAKVSRMAEPDPTQFDKKSEYYEPRASKYAPYWFCVYVKYVSTFTDPVALKDMKSDPKLKNMVTLKEPRLSVSPVSRAEFDRIIERTATKIPRLL